MPAAKLRPRDAEHDDHAVGHVLAAVIAHALDHRGCAGVAHREALAGDAVEEDLAAGCAVEDHVADQDALLGQEAGGLGRIDDDAPAGKPLAQVIVGVAFQFSVTPLGTNAPKLCPAEPLKLKWMVPSGNPAEP